MSSDRYNKLIASMAQSCVTKREEQTYFTGITFSPNGGGKTHIIRTAPAPIHMFCFDPHGVAAVEDEVLNGRVTYDLFADLDYKDPKVIREFEKRFIEYEKWGLFNSIKTVVIDTLTTYSMAAMYEAQKANKSSTPGDAPNQKDWGVHNQIVMKTLRRILMLPCNIILNCHEDLKEDDKRGTITRTIVGNKGLQNIIPALFAEVYYLKTTLKKGVYTNTFTTVPLDNLIARSRLSGASKKLDEIEPANYKAVFKKLGLPYADGPLLKDLMAEETTKTENKKETI